MKINYKIITTIIVVLYATVLNAQKTLLQSGPMACFADMREVTLWVQTTKPALVKIIYYDEKEPGTKYETDEMKTKKEDAFTAHLYADKVEPGKNLFIQTVDK